MEVFAEVAGDGDADGAFLEAAAQKAEHLALGGRVEDDALALRAQLARRLLGEHRAQARRVDADGADARVAGLGEKNIELIGKGHVPKGLYADD